MRENKKTWERGKTKIKHMRKFLSVIIAFVMLWSSVPVQAAGSEPGEKKTATITVESKRSRSRAVCSCKRSDKRQSWNYRDDT